MFVHNDEPDCVINVKHSTGHRCKLRRTLSEGSWTNRCSQATRQTDSGEKDRREFGAVLRA